MPTQRMSVVWADASGRTRTSFLTTSAGGSAVRAELVAVSNADWLQTWEGDLDAQVPAPAGGVYADVADTATLLFQTAAGAIVKVTLPAPDASIFLADGETVDPGEITALISQVLASAVTADGTALDSYVGGTRT